MSFLSTISPKRWRSWSRHGTRVRRWSSAAEARPWSACASGHLNTTTLAAFRQAPRGCVSCHKADDTHRGGFGTDRTSCHTTSRWEAARFDHAVFPIDHGTGRHTACTTCHNVPQRATTCHNVPNNYTRYTCYGCHEHRPARVPAQHRGEVRQTNLDNCLQCHGGGRGEGGERGESGERRERGERGERERRRRH